MKTYLILLAIESALSCTCPLTIKGKGQFLEFVLMFAPWIFIALTFFFAPEWWYGIIACAIYFLVPMLMSKETQTTQANPFGGIQWLVL